MYESPVNIYETIPDMVEKEIDRNIIVEIKRQLGIDINKEELIKALQYDRNQYDKGYQDGLNANKWVPTSERLPDKLNDVLITFYDCPNEYDAAYLRTTFNKTYKKNGAKNEWVSSMGETTYADYEVEAWMPIQQYKEESEV